MTAAQHLENLIAISSVSHESNNGVIAYARAALERSGWHCAEQPYTDDSGTVKSNLVATCGHPAAATLALVCHTDTVPYHAPSMLVPESRDGNIFGRGACDVKGFLACALTALTEPHDAVALILTADEEIGCIGARRFIESTSLRPRYAIVGEPTSLQPVRSGKGYCLAELTCHGREAHSAFPALGDSAILQAAHVVIAVESLARELESLRDESFDPPYTTLNVGVIRGGRAKNIVPGECTLLLEWRPIPGQPPELVSRRIAGCKVKILRVQPGFSTPAASPVVSVLSELSGRSPGTVSFGTEAPWIAQLGADCAVFGPGSMQVAHGDREHVPVAELERCVAVLQQAMGRLSAA